LTRERVNLSRRFVLLKPEDTKKRDFKRVPLHMGLMAILEKAMKVRTFGTDRVFLLDDRPVAEDSFRKP